MPRPRAHRYTGPSSLGANGRLIVDRKGPGRGAWFAGWDETELAQPECIEKAVRTRCLRPGVACRDQQNRHRGAVRDGLGTCEDRKYERRRCQRASQRTRRKGLTSNLAKKIRVYELARELGLTNKEGLDLCLAMGIGVTSHSSSIEDAQADRVRRKAEREGLKRSHQPPEPQGGAPEASPSPSSARSGATARTRRRRLSAPRIRRCSGAPKALWPRRRLPACLPPAKHLHSMMPLKQPAGPPLRPRQQARARQPTPGPISAMPLRRPRHLLHPHLLGVQSHARPVPAPPGLRAPSPPSGEVPAAAASTGSAVHAHTGAATHTATTHTATTHTAASHARPRRRRPGSRRPERHG